ncbi:DNA cytosine methyltransferase [Saccharomonospora piscinae]|uniref:DNA cytosine methyltransferase n=1 Tax=Saccharomonospora piscinae TaxID=687388 RepID=UPI00141E21C5|nr:DNA cytosine methyltransferase [Saccharomonospora piscinae]
MTGAVLELSTVTDQLRCVTEGKSVSKGHPLRAKRRPKFEEGADALRVVDLFAGCGGLTLGVAQAANKHGIALEVALAVDFGEAPTWVFKANFPTANVRHGSVEDYFDGALGANITRIEHKTNVEVGRVDLLIGGPPCQGHSNLNNHTRRDDPKNHLYLRMARAAEVLQPRAILIENVPAVVYDKQDVVSNAIEHLKGAGYVVATDQIDLLKLGVAQTRKRHILLAIRGDVAPRCDSVDALLQLQSHNGRPRDLRWAIGDLVSVEPNTTFDAAPKFSAENIRRMNWLIENDEYDLPNELRPKCHQGQHTYHSMYGRLRWDQPSQTITSGFVTMGRGRFVHPELPRTLTQHEAARIQGFPDYFTFEKKMKRELFRNEAQLIIGNAVPPQLTFALTAKLFNVGVLDATRQEDADEVSEILVPEPAADVAEPLAEAVA